MTQLDLHDRRELRRRTSDAASVTKTLGMAVAAISIVGSVFSAGYSWHSVSSLAASVAANQDQFVRKDVQDQQLRNVDVQLTEISRQIQELRDELRVQRRKE